MKLNSVLTYTMNETKEALNNMTMAEFQQTSLATTMRNELMRQININLKGMGVSNYDVFDVFEVGGCDMVVSVGVMESDMLCATATFWVYRDGPYFSEVLDLTDVTQNAGKKFIERCCYALCNWCDEELKGVLDGVVHAGTAWDSIAALVERYLRYALEEYDITIYTRGDLNHEMTERYVISTGGRLMPTNIISEQECANGVCGMTVAMIEEWCIEVLNK
jgi:hypothetical protein